MKFQNLTKLNQKSKFAILRNQKLNYCDSQEFEWEQNFDKNLFPKFDETKFPPTSHQNLPKVAQNDCENQPKPS